MKLRKTMLITATAVLTVGGAAAYAVLTNDWNMWATSPDAGGVTFADDGAGGDWSLGATAGQLDATVVPLEGGGWTVIGGFWPGAADRIARSCAGDANNDQLVNFGDILEVLAGWGDCPDPPLKCPGDLDFDGDVDFLDLIVVLTNWGCNQGVVGLATDVPFEDSLAAAGVSGAQWDAFAEVLEFGNLADADNWLCWMRRALLSDESFVYEEECPGADPLSTE